MNSGRNKPVIDFEEKENKIIEFEKQFTENEKQLEKLTGECQDLQQKLQNLEAKTSQDEVVASQIDDYRQKITELEEMSARLRTALGQLQEENIKLEDELNGIKTEHGDITELKAKLTVLEETVITQQKEIVDKDRILKRRTSEEDGGIDESAPQKFLVGKVETVTEFNRLLENVKFRLVLIVPTVQDLKQLKLMNNPNVDTRIATSLDLSNVAHKNFIKQFPNAEFRNYSKKDRWGIECDAEEICLVAESENKDLIGIASSDSKICELFLKLLTEAWLTATKISL